MLAYVGDCVGEKAEAVVELVVRHWCEFVKAATYDHGLFGLRPAEPELSFFVKYHDSAVNMMTESGRREKLRAEQEAEAAKNRAEEEQRRINAAKQRAEEIKQWNDMLDYISERYSLPRHRSVVELSDMLKICKYPSTKGELATALDEWEAENKKRFLLTWEEQKAEMNNVAARLKQKVCTQVQS